MDRFEDFLFLLMQVAYVAVVLLACVGVGMLAAWLFAPLGPIAALVLGAVASLVACVAAAVWLL